MNIEKGANISDCKQYRYLLWRIWDKNKPAVGFIGLNPSIADDQIDDPTIRRCMNYAKEWGYGGLYMANLFAYRATNPREMFKAKEPIGKNNDATLKELANKVDKIIVAWGDNGKFKERYKALNCLGKLYCLKINKSGQPAHPLYQPKNAQLIEYRID